MEKYSKIDELTQDYNDLINALWGVKTTTQLEPQQQPENQSHQRFNYQQPISGQLVSRHLPGKQFATPTHPDGHTGIDLKAERGTPIYSIGPGYVHSVGTNKKGGNFVKTIHENGKVKVYYAHLDSISVKPNQPIDKNTVLGTVGDTGNAIGNPHLHYQVAVNGSWIDPLQITDKMVGSLST